MTATDESSRLPFDAGAPGDPGARDAAGPLAAFVRACRPRQWAKNLLLAVPVFVGQQWDEPAHWIALAIAFACFGVTASGTYLVNDLFDLRADRAHPTKRGRPLASGALSPGLAVGAAVIMIAGALGASWAVLPPMFALALAVYVVLTLAYSLWAKRKAMLDVIWLACLYCLRIIAGGMAVSIIPSEWLLAFALFIFLSLAFAKRCSEMLLLQAEGGREVTGRAYVIDDHVLVTVMGVAAGYLGVLVLALYINSDAVTELYTHPQALWLVCPLLLYWISRLWHRAIRRQLRDDPLLFAMTDGVSYLVGALAIVVVLAAQ